MIRMNTIHRNGLRQMGWPFGVLCDICLAEHSKVLGESQKIFSCGCCRVMMTRRMFHSLCMKLGSKHESEVVWKYASKEYKTMSTPG